MSERNLWVRIRQHIGSAGHFERIENGVASGTPDVSFCIGGVEGHIELKFVKKYPKRASTPLLGNAGLRKEQIVWAIQRCRAGGRVFVLIGVGLDVFLVRLSEENARMVNEWTLAMMLEESVFQAENARKTPWPALLDALIS